MSNSENGPKYQEVGFTLNNKMKISLHRPGLHGETCEGEHLDLVIEHPNGSRAVVMVTCSGRTDGDKYVDFIPYVGQALKMNGVIVDEGLNKSTPSHIIIPAISNSGKQYRIEVEKTAHFDNLVVYMFPYIELDSVRFTHKDKEIEQARVLANTSSEKVAPGLWSISMMQALGDKPSTAVFYMPYSSNYEAYQVTDSWKLLPWTGKKLTKHVEVNGWANAWMIDDPTAVYDHEENLIVVVNKAEYARNMLQIGILIGVAIGVVILLILLYRTKRS